MAFQIRQDLAFNRIRTHQTDYELRRTSLNRRLEAVNTIAKAIEKERLKDFE